MDILTRAPLRADRRVPYAPGPAQFVELWLPPKAESGVKSPLVVYLHGGWWKSAYDVGHASFFCSALRDAGPAVCAIEYRRVGMEGGGWPGTFLDIAHGFSALERLPREVPVDLRRVLLVGHSAGAHLAFWLAGRHHIFAGSPIGGNSSAVAPVGAVSLGGAVDLGLTIELAQGEFSRNRISVERLMGGSPEEVPDRYLAGDPGHLLPLNLPQRLLQGTEDDQIPAELPQRWAEKARRVGDRVAVTMLPGAGHLDLIDPESKACGAVIAAIRQMLAM